MHLVGVIRERKSGVIKRKRVVASAFLCAILDVVVIVLAYELHKNMSFILVGIALAEIVFGAWVAYGQKSLLQDSILLFVVTMLFSGIFQLMPVNNVGLFCLVGTLLLPIFKGGITSLFRMKQTQTALFEAKLYQNEKGKQLSAFMDTGNRLRLYGSRVPVVLVDENYLTEWIKEAELTTPQKLFFYRIKEWEEKGFCMGYGYNVNCSLKVVKN